MHTAMMSMMMATMAMRTASTTPTIAPAERPPTVQATEKKIKELRCYDAKIEKKEKPDSHLESNPGHLCMA